MSDQCSNVLSGTRGKTVSDEKNNDASAAMKADQRCVTCNGTGRGRTPTGQCSWCHGTTVVHRAVEGTVELVHPGPRSNCDLDDRWRRCKKETTT
jgi:DnaJ-class molecular chaperone